MGARSPFVFHCRSTTGLQQHEAAAQRGLADAPGVPPTRWPSVRQQGRYTRFTCADTGCVRDDQSGGRVWVFDRPASAELRAGATQISVQYAVVPGGGQLCYLTTDPALIRAVHSWFAAQTADHGAHCVPGLR
jgi:hypothetical protein